MIGTSRMTIQAPWVNFVTAMIRSTTSDSNAPMPLIKEPARHPGSRVAEVVLRHARLRERERREHADRVERDEPVDLGVGDEQQMIAATARKMIPFENTSRCPRFVSWRGMKLSPAWKHASRGKSAKLVFAASTRMSIVPACSA